jgi:hypothetical protein
MSTTLERLLPIRRRLATARSAERAVAIPWYLYAVAIASTLVNVGIIWDISWHMTIGRDSFWTPAHLCTYLSALIVGVTCGYVALRTTFAGTAQERERSVSLWGFRAPLGAWICVWGSFAMLTSAPFDNWWHDAYGLDVQIISPPHTLLALGMISIVIGALVWTLAWQNRGTELANDPEARHRLHQLFAFAAGLLISMFAIYVTEYSYRGYQHGSQFYRVSAMAFPVVLVALSRASNMRWSATWAALCYMGVRIAMGWILPLFPATAKLGPIFNPMTHMAAMEFPLLLIGPAIAIDLLSRRLGKDASPGRDWITAPLFGLAFVVALLVVQWPFADFLHSPLARNWFFFSDRNFTYNMRPQSLYMTYKYFIRSADPSAGAFAIGMLVAVVYASISARVGLAWGRWMSKVQR